MLKNRQSSKVPVNLKRSAPSNAPAESEPLLSGKPQTLPHRSSALPAQAMPQPAAPSTPNRRQPSLDTAQAHDDNRPTGSSTQSSWMASTPELLTEPMTTPETLSATSLNNTFASQESSSLAWAQQFNNPDNLPDLMPMMFPSDDPFAYPTQPMSTLEDDHFRHDPSSMSQTQYPFDSSLQSSMGHNIPSDPAGAGVSTSGFDAYGNLRNFNLGPTSGTKLSMPGRLQANARSMTSSRLHSPISQGQTPSETLSSPDLVSIPNQNFVWQGYNFQPTTMETDNTTFQQDPPASNGFPDFNMGVAESTMGMNMDLGISFDDLFGNDTALRPNNEASNNNWNQWMNTGA